MLGYDIQTTGDGRSVYFQTTCENLSAAFKQGFDAIKDADVKRIRIIQSKGSDNEQSN